MPVIQNKSWGMSISPSERKLKTLQLLSIGGIKLSDGYDYRLYEDILPDSNLRHVRKILSTIKESLSQEIVKEREAD